MRFRIFQEARKTTQSGRARSQAWLIEPAEPAHRLPDPLMGWAGGEGALGELAGRLRFPCIEDAMSFARRYGLECEIDLPQIEAERPHAYMDKFRQTMPQDEERRLKERG